MNAITFVPPKTPRACRRDQSRGPQTPWSPRWLPTILAVVLMVAARGGGAAYGQTLTGLWEFGDSGNLAAATVGSDLTINGTSPTWNATETYGSTTLSGVITTIGGTANNLRAATGIGANGGGSRTNEYTFVWDVRTPGSGPWRSFFSTNLALLAVPADFQGPIHRSLLRGKIGRSTCRRRSFASFPGTRKIG
jgi:hypothetical protein